jgi:hypothetical protein
MFLKINVHIMAFFPHFLTFLLDLLAMPHELLPVFQALAVCSCLKLNLGLVSLRLSHRMILKICNRCHIGHEVTYACEHTEQKEMCVECYQYVHWRINRDIPEELNNDAMTD